MTPDYATQIEDPDAPTLWVKSQGKQIKAFKAVANTILQSQKMLRVTYNYR